MDQILNQLGGLVLGAVPTMVFFVLLVLAYGYLVRRPLDKVLADRRARTIGAMEQAREAISAAENEAAAYEEKLRRAKAELFAMREGRIKQWNEERDRILAEARTATASSLAKGKAEMNKGVAIARHQIEGVSESLSEQILRAILPSAAPPEVSQ